MMRSWSRLATLSRPSRIRRQALPDPADDRLLRRGPRRGGHAVEPVGVEAGLEEFDEHRGQVGVGDQRVLGVRLRERRSRLALVAGHRAQDDDLAPVQPGG